MVRKVAMNAFYPLVISLLLTSSLFAGGPASFDWPHWRGPRQNGVSLERNLPQRWSPEGENLLWRKEEFATRSTPIVMHGWLYTICRAFPESIREGEKVHCLDAKTGKPHWTHDMFAASWASPLIVDGKVYIGNEDGDVSVFNLSKEKSVVAVINMGSAVYSTPIVANNVLYIANRNRLFAIQKGASSKPAAESSPNTGND